VLSEALCRCRETTEDGNKPAHLCRGLLAHY
jgi:hypothetical protein